jgi:hypothetical protein
VSEIKVVHKKGLVSIPAPPWPVVKVWWGKENN